MCLTNESLEKPSTRALLPFAEALQALENNEIEYSIERIRAFERTFDLSLSSDMTFAIHNDADTVIRIVKSHYYFHKGRIFSRSISTMEEARKSFQLYYSYQVNIANLRKAEQEENKIVYSFRRVNEHCFSDLLNNTITVVSPRKMNDPFDTLLFSWLDYYADEVSENNYPEEIAREQEIFYDSAKYFRIRSFVSSKGRNHPYSNTLMWSHYANSHTGVCVKYSLSPAFMYQRREYGFSFMSKVNYPAKKSDKLSFSDEQGIDGTVALLAKSYEWKYENEIRLITYMPESESDYISIPLDRCSKVEAIYFGLKCSDECISAVKSIFKDRTDVKFFSMKKDYSNIYQLRPIGL